MKGAPANPISGTSPSAATSSPTASATASTPSSTPDRSAATSAPVRTGWAITGPTSGTMSRSMPAPRSGTTMSENRIAASTPCRRTGCRVISQISSASKQACIMVCLARSARYSGSERPAWRMNQTGTRLGLRPLAAARYGASGRSRRVLIASMLPRPEPPSSDQRYEFGAPAPETSAGGLASIDVTPAEPAQFREAVAAMNAAEVRAEIELGPIRPPQRLAPYSYALGAEVKHPETEIVPERSEGDAFGRLILLHDPDGSEAWDGTMRLVAYIQADLDPSEAVDPLLPEVAWSWLVDALDARAEHVTALGGTVTATTSVRYGDISGPPRAHQLEMRASWTATNLTLGTHVQAFCEVLEHAAGLPPVGVTDLSTRSRA